MSLESRYLLITACSQRKRSDSGPLPAIERYDGVNYRVLRKAQREGYYPQNLDVLILSAKYGLISAHTLIECYEQRMSHQRASELRSQTIKVLRTYSQQHNYREVFMNLGKDYLPAMNGFTELFDHSLIKYAKGRIGERLSQMKNWLATKCEE